MPNKKLDAVSLQNSEKRMLDEWRDKLKAERFIRDGMVNPEKYCASETRILVVLKEVNDKDGKEVWELTEFLNEPKTRKTWGPLSRWINGIQNLDTDYDWKDIKDFFDNGGKELLQSIAVVNVKKTPGGSSSDDKVLSEFALENSDNKDRLKKQIELYEPDIIICGGTAWIVKRILECKDLWPETKHGIAYYKFNPGPVVIDYLHPEAHAREQILYYSLIEAVKEILKEQK